MILLIDNFDSFVHNLARYFERLGQETLVVRNDAINAARIRELKPNAIVLSPGPCTPSEAGCSLDVVNQLSGEFPILGVCLGHQAIGQALGGKIVRAKEPMHGRASDVTHDARLEFAGVPQPFAAGRYHSLVIDETSLPPSLEVSARTADGTIMAVRHREHPTVGYQFHPEPILTECGFELLAGFLRRAGLPIAAPLPSLAEEDLSPRPSGFAPPERPVTF